MSNRKKRHFTGRCKGKEARWLKEGENLPEGVQIISDDKADQADQSDADQAKNPTSKALAAKPQAAVSLKQVTHSTDVTESI